jgi:hypothetical protein
MFLLSPGTAGSSPPRGNSRARKGDPVKKLVMLLLASMTATIAASSAAGYANHPMTGRHDLLRCVMSWTVGNPPTTINGVIGDGSVSNPFYASVGATLATDPQITAPSPNPPDPLQPNPPGQVRGGTISSTDSTYLSIAWATTTQAQLEGFLGVAPYKPNQYGTITVHPGTPTATPVLTRTWAVGNSDYWTAPQQIHNPGFAGGQPTAYLSRLYVPIGQLPTGTYFVDADLELSKPSYDGVQTYHAGPWFSLSGCRMIVS